MADVPGGDEKVALELLGGDAEVEVVTELSQRFCNGWRKLLKH